MYRFLIVSHETFLNINIQFCLTLIAYHDIINYNVETTLNKLRKRIDYTMNTKQMLKIALRNFGTFHGFSNDCIERTINDDNVLNAIIECIELNEHDLITYDLNVFLHKFNDIEMNAIIENFVNHENE